MTWQIVNKRFLKKIQQLNEKKHLSFNFVFYHNIKKHFSRLFLDSLRPTNIGNNNSNLVDKNGTNNGGNKNQMDDDEEETFESVFSNLPADLKPLKDCMYKAQGCCLLLILKQFLKEVYSISDR